MNSHSFYCLQPHDEMLFELLADWYRQEWNMTPEGTVARLKEITLDEGQFQVVLSVDNRPVGTAGLYNHVGLLDKEPRFKVYSKWMALVYIVPEMRGKGHGAALCRWIEEYAQQLGFSRIYLFTDTAEQLYLHLGWQEVERLSIHNRDLVVMERKCGMGIPG